MDEPTHYQVLGVDADAQPADIRRAYRAKAKQAHPDTGGDQATFLAVRTAFEVLDSPLDRRDYDDRLGIRAGVRWDSPARRGARKEGWTGQEGDFSGDVEFPTYLRDITEAPWKAGGSVDPVETDDHLRAADVSWWWPHLSINRPVYANGTIIAGTERAVVAIDPFDGHDVWRAGMPADPACSVAVVGQTVIVWTSDGTLHGLEAARGVTRWEAPVGPPSRAGMVSLAGQVLVARDDGALSMISVADGSTSWSARLAGQPSFLAADGQHAVLITSSTTIEAVELRRGRHRWRTRSRYPVGLPPVPLDSSVWVSGGRAALHRLDIATGAVHDQWSSTTAIAGVVADDDTLYVTVAGPAQLVAIDPLGALRWSVSTPDVSPEPDVSSSRVVLVTPSGRLSVHDPTNGSVIDAVQLPIDPHGPPLVARDQIVVRERSGRLWAVRSPV